MSTMSIRLSEGSTWRGLVYVLAGTAITLFPEYTTKITAISFGLTGTIGILFSDSPTTIKTIPTK